MKIYRKDTGEKYTPFNHYDMTTQVIFNQDSGCRHANITLSTIGKGAGSEDEVHEYSDQIFYIIKGELKISIKGEPLQVLHEGDAVMVEAGDVHAVTNDREEDCVFCSITVPPLHKTH